MIKIVLKTIVFIALCLVLCFLPGCTDEPPAVRIVPLSEDPGFADQGPLYIVTVPDSIQSAVVWEQNLPLLISLVSQSTMVVAGDTILSGTDPFFSVEIERLEMALSIAQATGDTIAMDSLIVLLSDSSSFVFVTAPITGTMTVQVSRGSTLQPGDTIAMITGAPPDSVYILSPDYYHIRWPENLQGYTVTETGLQHRGAWPGERTSIPGTWSIQARYIYEDGLDSFLIAAAGDTLPITIIGSTDTSKIIYSEFPLDSLPLTPW